MFEARIKLEGLPELEAAFVKINRELSESGEAGKVIRLITMRMQRFAPGVTHVITGALRSSHRFQIDGLRGVVFPDPAVINPDTGKSVSTYAEKEELKGGDHAFYARTVQVYGRQALQSGANRIARALP